MIIKSEITKKCVLKHKTVSRYKKKIYFCTKIIEKCNH